MYNRRIHVLKAGMLNMGDRVANTAEIWKRHGLRPGAKVQFREKEDRMGLVPGLLALWTASRQGPLGSLRDHGY